MAKRLLTLLVAIDQVLSSDTPKASLRPFVTDNLKGIKNASTATYYKSQVSVDEGLHPEKTYNVAETFGQIEASMEGDLSAAGDFTTQYVTTGIVADITPAQGTPVISNYLNVLGTVAAAGESVTLKTAVAGDVVRIINQGVDTAAVYPGTDDQIDENAVDAIDPNNIPVNGERVYYAVSASKWITVS